jgi:hypothetical protein
MVKTHELVGYLDPVLHQIHRRGSATSLASDQSNLMERGMRPVFVGFGYTSGALGAITAERDLRPDDDQGQAR